MHAQSSCLRVALETCAETAVGGARPESRPWRMHTKPCTARRRLHPCGVSLAPWKSFPIGFPRARGRVHQPTSPMASPVPIYLGRLCGRLCARARMYPISMYAPPSSSLCSRPAAHIALPPHATPRHQTDTRPPIRFAARAAAASPSPFSVSSAEPRLAALAEAVGLRIRLDDLPPR